jgi:phenylacetate-CoA ligase
VLRGARLPPGRMATVNRMRREVSLSLYDLSPSTLEKYLRLIGQRPGLFLHAYPSAALHLARLCEEAGVAPPRFRALLIGSEAVTPVQIARLSRFFQAPVYTWYGMTEKVLLGGVCPLSNRYHLHPDYGVAEIVDGAGRAIREPGVEGRLLGTGLLNACAPLIRYDTGDLAAWAEGCACGWPGQVLEHVAGRAQDVIRCPSGIEVPVSALNLHTGAYRGVHQIQYRLTRPGLIDLQTTADRTADLVRLRREVSARLPGCTVRVRRVPRLDPGPNGKVPLLVRPGPR